MLARIRHRPAPSRNADSSRSSGIDWKKVRRMIMFHTAIAVGKNSAHMELTIPSARTSR